MEQTHQAKLVPGKRWGEKSISWYQPISFRKQNNLVKSCRRRRIRRDDEVRLEHQQLDAATSGKPDVVLRRLCRRLGASVVNAADDVLQEGVRVDVVLVKVVEVDALRLHVAPGAIGVLQGHADAAALGCHRATGDRDRHHLQAVTY